MRLTEQIDNTAIPRQDLRENGHKRCMEKLAKIEDMKIPIIEDMETIENAIEIYGNGAQTDIAIEEMSELTKALLKYRRAENVGSFSGCDYDFSEERKNISEEIADVFIMLVQLLLIYNCDCDAQEQVNKKVARLKKRLQDIDV